MQSISVYFLEARKQFENQQYLRQSEKVKKSNNVPLTMNMKFPSRYMKTQRAEKVAAGNNPATAEREKCLSLVSVPNSNNACDWLTREQHKKSL
jgi:hypothetical protein